MSSFVVEVNNRAVGNALQQAIKSMPDVIDSAVQRAAIEVGRELKRAAPKAFSTLTNSIKEDRIKLMEWRVGPHVDYAQYVEEGTSGGGKVPFQAMLSWIKVKGIQPRNPEWSLTDLAWVIQKSILAKGSRKQPFVQPVIDSGFAQQRLDQLVAKAAERVIDEAGL